MGLKFYKISVYRKNRTIMYYGGNDMFVLVFWRTCSINCLISDGENAIAYCVYAQLRIET